VIMAWIRNAAVTSTYREECMAETLKKGTRVTGADRTKLAADLKKRYNGGESIRSLAASTGRSYGFIHRILTENGVSLRGRGGATRGKAKGKR
jgi:Helix-turn-helix domain